MIKKFKIEYQHIFDATSIYFKRTLLFIVSFKGILWQPSCMHLAQKPILKPFYTDTDQTWLSEKGHETNI